MELRLSDYKVNLNTEVQSIKGVGPALAKKMHKLGMETVRDLIFYYPKRYEDYTKIDKISDLNSQFEILNLKSDQRFTIKGTILGIANKRTSRRGFTVTEALIEDGSGTLKVIWFNQPFLLKLLPAGREVILNGKVTFNMYSHEYVMESPNRTNKPCIVPIYGETAGLSSNLIQKLVLHISSVINELIDYLPAGIIKENNLLPLGRAIRTIHFPRNSDELKEAQRRLAFDELFLISLRANISREQIKKEEAVRIKIVEEDIKNFVHGLPFELTSDQRKSAWQIIKDMQEDSPMNRLLNGDVGSGKTVVAAIAAFAAVKAGYRVILMVPTAILAAQHYETFKKLFDNRGISVGLYTRERKQYAVSSTYHVSKEEQGIKTQDTKYKILNTDLIVGTQALIQKDVEIENVGLVIVDEQHRFGVKQRQVIGQVKSQKSSVLAGSPSLEGKAESITRLSDGQEKYQVAREKQEQNSMNHQLSTTNPLRPHFLSMTATPIPRTLHLALFGDLDLSVIREKPQNRKEIKTRFVQDFNRQKAYNFISDQIIKGYQAFVICPLIEEKDKEFTNLFEEDKKSVTAEYKKLSEKIFPQFKIGMLHGKMKQMEKDEIMAKFSSRELNILVSTSVVEVGVNIPNATVMMVEDADRFGLAQIHQFRGRVGRSNYQSYCFLFSSTNNPKTLNRLISLENTSDGFRLAEIDLETRGPGELFGTVQSGDFELKMASMSDRVLIEEASHAAKSIVELDSELNNHPLLKEKISEFLNSKHME